LGGKGFEVSKSHNEDKVFREPVDTPLKRVTSTFLRSSIKKNNYRSFRGEKEFCFVFLGKKKEG